MWIRYTDKAWFGQEDLSQVAVTLTTGGTPERPDTPPMVALIVLGVYDAGASDDEAQQRTMRGTTMAFMMGRAVVEDYAAFRKVFDDAEEMRQAAGALNSAVYQSVDDPNEVIIRIEFPTADAAKAFSTSQVLRDAMQKAGLQGPPRILIVNET